VPPRYGNPRHIAGRIVVIYQREIELGLGMQLFEIIISD